MDVQCSSLEDVRQRIDEIDRAMVELIARRGGFVAQAARFKKDSADIRAPARVEQVYRAMIAAFIDEELRAHAALGAEGGAV